MEFVAIFTCYLGVAMFLLTGALCFFIPFEPWAQWWARPACFAISMSVATVCHLVGWHLMKRYDLR